MRNESSREPKKFDDLNIMGFYFDMLLSLATNLTKQEFEEGAAAAYSSFAEDFANESPTLFHDLMKDEWSDDNKITKNLALQIKNQLERYNLYDLQHTLSVKDVKCK